MDFLLNDIEVRILGSLMEKSLTTPDYYPLSFNALTNACNQKTNREPVVDYDETIVVRGLDSLREKHLVVLSTSSRVPKYSEIFTNTRKMVTRETALIMVLLLRGPQTIGELRNRTERIYRFENLSDVEETLEELCSIGYITKLPRMAGHKEPRFAHLLAGDVDREDKTLKPEPATVTVRAKNERLATLEAELQQLRQDFNVLQTEFEKFRKEFE